MEKKKKILFISFILIFLIFSYYIFRVALSNFESKSEDKNIGENKKVEIDKDNKKIKVDNEKGKLKKEKKDIAKKDSVKNSDTEQYNDDDLVIDNDVSIPRDVIEENHSEHSDVNSDENSEQRKQKSPNSEEKNINAEPSDKYILLNSNLRKDKYLVFDKNKVALPKKSLVGLANTGEFENKLHELEWSGDSLEDVKSGKTGDYEVIAKIKDDLEINGHDYGKVIIKVKVRVK
ncbi:hypothetical protein ABGF38_00510 [Helcococcus ovis]|uniref:hypothetical protein n=1 Tax=Helcococcus ovis TaxID=72026 RepID=UPI0038BDF3EE